MSDQSTIPWNDVLDKVWREYEAERKDTRTTSKQVFYTCDLGDNENVPKNPGESELEYFEHEYNNRTLQYTFNSTGNQPKDGYPLYIGLHGGGGAGTVDEFNTWSAAGQKRRFGNNNRGWEMMSSSWYWKGIEKAGRPAVYVAPRGIVNTWDLHFQPESYELIEILIRKLLVKEPAESTKVPQDRLNKDARTFVNPNRVYLMGFSAGADAIYRHAAAHADIFAAVNTSGGHPGDFAQFTDHHRLWNCANLPILVQVGDSDNDDDLHRHMLAARTTQHLNHAEHETKTAGWNGLFVHDCFIHQPQKGHSLWDGGETNPDFCGEDHTDNKTRVISTEPAALEAWRKRNETGPQSDDDRKNDVLSDVVNTNASTWLINHPAEGRNPTPRYILWHLRDRPPKPKPLTADWEPKRFFYWIAIGKDDAAKLFDQEGDPIDPRIIEVSYNPDAHSIWIARADVPFTMLLTEAMFPQIRTKGIRITHGAGSDFKVLDEAFTLTADYDGQGYREAKEAMMKWMLLERGDPAFAFETAVHFDPVARQVRLGFP